MSNAANRPQTLPDDPATMRAVVQPAYGTPDVLRLAEVERPRLGPGDVLVRVRAASVCKGDVHLLTGKPYVLRLVFGLRRPRSPLTGQNLAGTVVAVGEGVTGLAPGDAVFGQTDRGAFAEYARARADELAKIPDGLDFETAAALPVSGSTALQGLRDAGRLQPGQRVLINGASGGVGTYAVQLARALGAEVTAVCSARHVDRVRALGAGRVVDYTREDFAALGPVHDVMLDLVGNRSLAAYKAALQPRGVFVSSAGSPGGNWLGPIVWPLKVSLAGALGKRTMTPLLQRRRREDLSTLATMVAAGQLTPVIDRRFALDETAAALRHVAEGHAHGTTVIAV